MRWNELDAEECSIARTLSVVGDRWTLLVLRECFLRVRRFDQFQKRLKITRHVLANRLKKLVEEGVLAKVAYQERPERFEYRLTDKGLDLYPVMMSLVHWGDVHMAGADGPPILHRHKTCDHVFEPVMTCSQCQEPLDARQVDLMSGKNQPEGVITA